MSPATLRTLARASACDTGLNQLTQHLQDVAAELRPFVQKEHPMVRQRHLARHWHVAHTDQPRIRDGVVGARHGRVVTNAVSARVRTMTRWMRVVSMASARVIAGRIVVRRRASIDCSAPGEPGRRTLGAEPLLELQF
jgi:hypothetical protein